MTKKEFYTLKPGDLICLNHKFFFYDSQEWLFSQNDLAMFLDFVDENSLLNFQITVISSPADHYLMKTLRIFFNGKIEIIKTQASHLILVKSTCSLS